MDRLKWKTAAGTRDVLAVGHPIVLRRPTSRAFGSLGWTIVVPAGRDTNYVAGWEMLPYYSPDAIEPPEFGTMDAAKEYVTEHLAAILDYARKYNDTGETFDGDAWLKAWEERQAEWDAREAGNRGASTPAPEAPAPARQPAASAPAPAPAPQEPPGLPPGALEAYAAKNLARRTRDVAARLRGMADAVDRLAQQIEEQPTKKSPIEHPYGYLASLVIGEVLSGVNGATLGGIASEAAAVESYRRKGE